MNFIKIEGSNVPRWINFEAVKQLWIEEYSEEFCERYHAEDERFSVVADHDYYLRGFKTYDEAEAYIKELLAALNGEPTNGQTVSRP